jgi:Deoxynucleotide monophosphate kinase
MEKIIGITGKAGSGKDTIVEMFLKNHEHPLSQRLAFGDGVKHSAAAIFREDLGNFYENKEELSERWGITYREMLQKLGTEFARDMIDPDFWVKWLEVKIREVPDAIKLIFITDVRFDNEAMWIKQQGGIVVEVIRDGDSTLASLDQLHSSEGGITHSLVDYAIVNRETPENLGIQMDKVLKEAGVVKGWIDPAKDLNWD